MPKRPTPAVELVVVGDELLSGRVVDTNSAFLGRRLSSMGLCPVRTTKVGDDEVAIRDALATAVGRAGVVVVTGGTGPTPDDRTSEAVAGFLGRKLVLHRPTLSRVRTAFRRRGLATPMMAERQALVPQHAQLLTNPVGMVPGVILEHGQRVVVLLPGVPVELETVFIDGVEPFLKSRFHLKPARTATVRTFGIAESAIAGRMTAWMTEHSGVHPAFYPSTSGVDVVLHSSNRTGLRLRQHELALMLGSAVYALDESPMEAVVGRLLRGKKLTVATAESCTGGLIGDRLTNVPGSSDYYLGSVVSYANEVKRQVLGVRPDTLARYGAVSEPTVRQMVIGIRELLAGDIGIVASGIAGPGGASAKKPVGLVYVAVGDGRRTVVERQVFGGNRRMVKERSASAALDLCRRFLEGKA